MKEYSRNGKNMNIAAFICIFIIVVSLISITFILYTTFKIVKFSEPYDIVWIKKVIQSLVLVSLFLIIIFFTVEVLEKIKKIERSELKSASVPFSGTAFKARTLIKRNHSNYLRISMKEYGKC